ncbi:MAG: hypothetical protein ACRES7_09700 [Gammaproteobacteria bacterium]
MTTFDRFVTRIARTPPLSAALVLGLGVLPVIDLLSGALLALVVLWRGYLVATVVGLTALAGFVVLGWASGSNPLTMLLQPFGGPLVIIWLPAFLLAVALRSSRSLAVMVTIGALVGCVAVIAQLTLIAHPLDVWHQLLAHALAPLKDWKGLSAEQWNATLVAEAQLMPGMSAAGLMLAAGAMVLFARYLQARLLHPGAFGEEFRRLNLGRVVTVLGSLVLVGRLISPGLLLKNLAIVMLVMFAFQGFAVIHSFFHARHWPRAGLVVFYVLVALLPLILVGLVSGAGLVDNWFDFRRLRAPPPAT